KEVLTSISNQQAVAWTLLSNRLTADFTKRTDELEGKYVSAQAGITNITDNSTLTPLERRLVLSNYIGKEYADKILSGKNMFHMQSIDGSQVRIVGSTYEDSTNRHDIAITLFNTNNNAIIASYVYRVDTENLEKDSKIRKTISIMLKKAQELTEGDIKDGELAKKLFQEVKEMKKNMETLPSNYNQDGKINLDFILKNAKPVSSIEFYAGNKTRVISYSMSEL
ncbi:MAG: hypothetical protein AABW67_06120, partial [Nanoarchaeota archaeon]